jgi:hypothetical protein
VRGCPMVGRRPPHGVVLECDVERLALPAAAVVGDTAYLLPMGCQEPRWPRTLVAYDTTADVATVLVGGLGGGTLLSPDLDSVTDTAGRPAPADRGTMTR